MPDELRNPFTGQTIRFLEETDELLVMESTYQPGGAPAPPHFHPAQDERFTVLEGSVRAATGSEAMVLVEGDRLTIPAGMPHEFGGSANEAGTVRWEVRPPLRTREFFERLFGALNAVSEGREEEHPFDVADYEDVFRVA